MSTTKRGLAFRVSDSWPLVWSTDHAEIRWQSGTVPAEGVNGHQPQEVLELVAERLRELNETVPSRETSLAITNVEQAILWLDERTRDRVARGVEGTHER